MTVFLFLTVLAALLVAILLWRAQRVLRGSFLDDAAAGWSVMVARRREIEEDPDIDPALRETLIAEWQEQAAAMPRGDANQDVPVGQRMRWLLPVGVVAVAAATYGMVGDMSEPALRLAVTSTAGPSALMRETPPRPGENHPGGKGSIEERIAALEEKLAAEPENLEGWVILARSRGLQRDYPAAVKALEQALKLAPGHPDLLADLADAVAMAQGEKMAGRPVQLVAEALKSDPKHQKSLALAATAAMQANDRESAVKLWRKLQSQFLPGDSDYVQIGNILAQLGEGAPAAPPPAAQAPAAAAPSPSASAGNSGGVISGQVALSPAAVQELRKTPPPASAVLYVLAKAVDGPPMPLAVLRLPLKDLAEGRMVPFQLDDTQAMSPQLTLSKFKQVSVEARVSLSGNAIRQPGDWSAIRSPVSVGTEGLPLQIEPAAKGR